MMHEHVFGQANAIASALAIVDVQMLVIKGLAVAGGAAVGYFLGGWFLWLVGRLFFFRKVPPRAVGTVRLLSMIALGMLVYLWVFGNSTAGGLGGGGGWWPFGGKAGQGDNAGTASTTEPVQKPPEERTEEPAKALEQGRTLQIRMLGGDRVIEQRFYQVEGQASALNWLALRKLLEQQASEEPPLKGIEIVLFKDSVDRDNPAVTQVENWARDKGLTSKIVLPAGDIAPR